MKQEFIIAICDDNKTSLGIIRSTVEAIFSEKNIQADIHTYTDFKVFDSDRKKISFDLNFFDIETPTIDGISYSNMLRKEGYNVPIIFVSNREDKVFDAFESQPVGFIRKKNFINDIEKIIDDFFKKYKQTPDSISFDTDGQITSVSVSDIIYISADKRNQYVYLANKKEPLKVTSTISKLSEELTKYSFVECFKGVLINPAYIVSIYSDSIKMKNNDIIPMSRRKANDTKKAYMDYLSKSQVTVF